MIYNCEMMHVFRYFMQIFSRVGLLLVMMCHSSSAQINYALHCSGSLACNNGNSGTVEVAVTESVRKLRISSTSTFDVIYAPALFGADIYTNAISGPLKYFSNPDVGCIAYAAGTFAGKVALIDRGTCSFESKAINAQNAGALGVIIVNNVSGTPTTLGGTNLLGVTIPVVMISQSDGWIIKNLLAQPLVVSGATPKYTYQWNSGATTKQVSGLKAGTYVVTVLANGSDTTTCSTQILSSNSSVAITVNSSVINCPFEPVDLAVADLNNALTINGTNQWVNLNTDVTNLNNASFTLEAWIKTSSGSQGIIVSSNGNNVWEAGERAFYIDDIGRPSFSGFDNNGITSSLAVDDGKWHHVAVVWNYTTPPGIGKIYVDGFDRTSTSSYAVSASANIGTFKIGRANYAATQAPDFFDGQIDEVRIWNIPRTSIDILTGLVQPVAPNTPGLLSYFKFDEASGSVVINASNSGANGSFVNTPLRTPAFKYQWTPSGDTTTTITASAAGKYVVTMTDYVGCITQSEPVFINSTGITPSGAVTICSGDSLKLDAGKNKYPVFGFTDFFNTDTWSTMHSANDVGVVNDGNAPYSVVMSSSNAQVPSSPASSLSFCHTMNGDGLLKFNWVYAGTDGPQNDYPEYSINGTSSSFPGFNYNIGGGTNQSGEASIPVLKGQNFCFRMNTVNNQGTAATFNISTIQFPDTYTAYLWSTGATTQSVYVKQAGSYYVSITASNNCTVTSVPVSITVNNNPVVIWYVDADGDGFGNAGVDSFYCYQPIGFVANRSDCNDATEFIHPSANENCFNAIDDNCNNIISEGCGNGTFQLKALLQGLYNGGGYMFPSLFNSGLHPDPNVSDSINVLLRSPVSPYTPIQTNQVLLYKNGLINIPTYPSPGSYYIVLKYRNGIETWSKTPVIFNGRSVFYDFSK